VGSTPTLSTIFIKGKKMKPGPNYKMTKQSKRFLATIVDPHKRASFKAGSIQAELAALVQPRREKNRRETTTE
jgi:hypothetical protein